MDPSAGRWQLADMKPSARHSKTDAWGGYCECSGRTKISNQVLRERTQTQTIKESIKIRRSRHIGNFLRKGNEKDQKVALTWTPEGKRQRGIPRETWRRSAEKERNEMGWPSWRTAEEATRDRPRWRDLCLASCSSRNEEDRWDDEVSRSSLVKKTHWIKFNSFFLGVKLVHKRARYSGLRSQKIYYIFDSKRVLLRSENGKSCYKFSTNGGEVLVW